MLGINKGLIWGQFRAPDKESVNTVERLCKSQQIQPLTVSRVVVIEGINETFPQD